MGNIIVTTVPERFEIPEDYVGAVTRGGVMFPEPVEARNWLPGDVVDCLMRVSGKLCRVRITVGSVTCTSDLRDARAD